MAHLSLYRKYRPQTFAEILGQEHVSGTLSNAIKEDRVAHAYLFTGPRGTGKTSTARILAKALNCAQGPTPSPCGTCGSCIAITEGSSLDVIEIDAASHSKVEETREILAGVPLAAAMGRKKVYVIDEVHMLSQSAFNALLKTLEEPPEHVVFVLATTEVHKVLSTIVSRTQRFDFRRVSTELIEENLANVAKLENIDIDPGALAIIARHADGGVRDAQSMLDQLANWGTRVSPEDVSSLLGGGHFDDLSPLFDAIAAGDVGAVFSAVDAIVRAGADVKQLAIGVLERARSLLFLKSVPDAEGTLDVAPELAAGLAAQAERFSGGDLMRLLDLTGKAWTEMRNVSSHRLLLEVALVRAAEPGADPSASGLLGRIERLERRSGMQTAAAPAPSVSAATPAPATPIPEAPAPPAPSEVAPAPPPAPSEVAPAGPDEVGLTHIRDSWEATIKEVNRRSRRVGAFLNPSKPVRLDDGVLVVEVQSSFHADAMADERNSGMLAESVYAALGTRLRLRFVARDAEPEPRAADAESPIEATSVAADHDPVELIKKGLAAEVVDEERK